MPLPHLLRRAAVPLLALAGLTAPASAATAPEPAPAVAATTATAAVSATASAATTTATTTAGVPRYAHVVVVVLENSSRAKLLGPSGSPYLRSLAGRGADLTRSSALTHPSQPNYVALFSGGTHGVTDDTCPQVLRSDNLAAQVLRSGQTFVGYSEDLPGAGSLLCGSGLYARRHAPWTNFPALPQAKVSKPFSQFPSSYSRLPTVSFVIPNVCHDLHSCPVAVGDRWLRAQLDGYARWAVQNNSLLVVTTDEGDGPGNDVATLLVGAHVVPGQYADVTDHYRLLRTIEAAVGLPGVGAAASRTPLTSPFARV